LIESDPQTAESTVGQSAHPILPVSPARIRTHQVRKGETLGGIARQHRCNVRTLASANNIRAPRYLLRVGQRLRLEGCSQ